MRNLIFAIAFFLTLSANGFSQSAPKADAELDNAMTEFVKAIETQNTTAFLKYISQEKGLRIMNTIDQGEEGNEDNPILDAKLSYQELSANLRGKGEHYKGIFLPSEDSPNFHDAFAKRQWQYVGNGKFHFIDPETGEPTKALYMKWELLGEQWFVIEVGRYIS